MKKLFKTHQKHPNIDGDDRALSPFSVVQHPNASSPAHFQDSAALFVTQQQQQRHQSQQKQQQQQLQTQYASQQGDYIEQRQQQRAQYRNSMAACPSVSSDDISSWELINSQSQTHPYKQHRIGGAVTDRERSASVASLSALSSSNSSTTLPNPYSSQTREPRPHTPPYAQVYGTSRTPSLNSLSTQGAGAAVGTGTGTGTGASQPSPRTATVQLVSQPQSQPSPPTIPPGSAGSHVPSPTSPGPIGAVGAPPGMGLRPGSGGGGGVGVLRKKGHSREHGYGQAPIAAQPQSPNPPPPQASTAAILRALDPSMGILGGGAMNVGNQNPQKAGLSSKGSIRSAHREREQKDARYHLPSQPPQQQQQHGHGHLRVPVLSSRKNTIKSNNKAQVSAQQYSFQSQFQHQRTRTRSHSRSRSLSDIEFNAAADGEESAVDINMNTSPPSSTSGEPTRPRRRSSRSIVDGDMDADTDPYLERDSLEIERRGREKEREKLWRERDMLIETEKAQPRKGNIAAGTKEKEKDRDSRGFFDRLQLIDSDPKREGGGVREREKDDKDRERKDKKEKEDWVSQFTSIFAGKDKDRERTKKHHRDMDSIDPLTPYPPPSASSQAHHQHQHHQRPEISAPLPISHPLNQTPNQNQLPPHIASHAIALPTNELMYHSTPPSNAPLLSLSSRNQAPTGIGGAAGGGGGDHLARMVGLFVSPSAEGIDWALALELCEKTKGSEKEPGRDRRDGRDMANKDTGKDGRDGKEAEANSKSIAKALRKELKYARPSEQLGAVTLWAVMLQNASDIFITQTSSRKFLDVVEDVILHARSTIVRDRLVEVLGAAAYLATHSGGKDASKRDNFKTLWRKVKPEGYPEEGMPLSTDNPIFQSQSAVHSNSADINRQKHQLQPPTNERRSSRNGIIPVDEDMRRLFQECKIGRGNAALLNEALAFATPEDLRGKDIIKEFYAKCLASQELIYTQIPWASAGAERSRERQQETLSPEQNVDELPPTREEKLLAELLAANEELAEALRIYGDIERIGLEKEEERRARERSRVEIRATPMDYQMSGEASNFLVAPSVGQSSSRSQSPSSFVMNSQTSQTSILPPSSDQAKYAADTVPMSAATLHHQQHFAQVHSPQPHISGSDSSHSYTPSHNQSHNHVYMPPNQGGGHLAPAPTRLLHGPRSPPPSGAAIAAAAAAGMALGGVHSRTSSPVHPSRPNSVVHSRTTSLDASGDGEELDARLERETSEQTISHSPSPAPVPRDSLAPATEPAEPVKLSEKAAGKRRAMVDIPLDLNDGTPNGDALHVEDVPFDSLRSEFDTDDGDLDDTAGGGRPDRWRRKTQYAYDAAAERTRERLRELGICAHDP